MSTIGLLFIILAKICHTLLNMYQFVVIVAVIMTWIRPSPTNDFIRTLLVTAFKLTEPVFSFVRRKLPKSFFSFGIDFTPIIVLFAIYAVDILLTSLFMDIGIRLRMGAMPSAPVD